ncbi:MAG: imidazole glycerol phosphate synthase subunit HisH, partial [Halioglobus sp.]|nr:imidazole glycerol phosphate synthase subunit HisH [Halioglobus sp.]
MTVVVVDYGMGNLRSVERALRHVAADLPGQEVVISDRATDIDRAERVVFPGQGAMASGLRELRERGLLEAVVRAAREKPFLGICLGL